MKTKFLTKDEFNNDFYLFHLVDLDIFRPELVEIIDDENCSNFQRIEFVVNKLKSIEEKCNKVADINFDESYIFFIHRNLSERKHNIIDYCENILTLIERNDIGSILKYLFYVTDALNIFIKCINEHYQYISPKYFKDDIYITHKYEYTDEIKKLGSNLYHEIISCILNLKYFDYTPKI